MTKHDTQKQGWAWGWYQDVQTLRDAAEEAIEAIENGYINVAKEILVDALESVPPFDDEQQGESTDG